MLVSDRMSMLTRNYNAKIVDVNTRIHAVCACLPISLVSNVLPLHPWIQLHEPFGRLLVFHQVIMLSKILMRADSYIRLNICDCSFQNANFFATTIATAANYAGFDIAEIFSCCYNARCRAPVLAVTNQKREFWLLFSLLVMVNFELLPQCLKVLWLSAPRWPLIGWVRISCVRIFFCSTIFFTLASTLVCGTIGVRRCGACLLESD